MLARDRAGSGRRTERHRRAIVAAASAAILATGGPVTAQEAAPPIAADPTPPSGAEAALPLPAASLAYPEAAPSELTRSGLAAPKQPRKPDEPPTAAEICRAIAANAEAVGMPKAFFARLIYKESRFDVKAISPVGARGIAQFMPYTAAERGLENPYDYESAIRHSALYLKDIKNRLGNWGLAAAGYNGGPNRVAAWMNESGGLPYETREYVNAITFRPAHWFTEDGNEVETKPLDPDLDFQEGCANLPVMKTRAVFASLDPEGGSESGPDPVPMKPWGVQVAGHADRGIAMRMFQRIKGQFSGVLGDKRPLVIRDRAPVGRIYAVRIGAGSRAGAQALCGRLRSAGGSCIVTKN